MFAFYFSLFASLNRGLCRVNLDGHNPAEDAPMHCG